MTYNQKLSGVQRGDPNAETHEHRWGGSIGGPLIGSNLFFYGNYEGSNSKSIFGGGIATVPTVAMRNGDFRGTAIAPRDPQTGLPFPDRVIPSNRIDPSARATMDFFYPLPNLSPMANGYGRFQQFVPKTRERHRGDIRLDYQPGSSDSLFVRGSFQHRNPNSITFEAGNAFTHLPHLNAELNTSSVVGGWTKIFSPTIVNEFRAGFNYDNSRRESTFLSAELAPQLGVENAPSLSADRRGFPSFQFTTGANRPTNIADQGRNVDRTLRQNAFSISDNVTWIRGGHTLKGGGLWSLNTRSRRFWLRRQFPRAISVQRIVHRQCLYGFPVGSAFGCA